MGVENHRKGHYEVKNWKKNREGIFRWGTEGNTEREKEMRDT